MNQKVKYLCIGHVCMDIDENSNYTLGGSASFASLVANQLGNDVCTFTSFGANFKFINAFDKVDLLYTKSKDTTIFQNIYKGDSRKQIIHTKASSINYSQIEEKLLLHDVIHVCPIIDEVSISTISNLPDESLIIVTPQGWLRDIKQDSSIVFKDIAWINLTKATFVIISEEDVNKNEEYIKSICYFIKRLIVTRGHNGVSYFLNGKEVFFPTKKINAIDPTGAGDCFATAFAHMYFRSSDVEASINYGQKIAAICISHPKFQFLKYIAP